MKFWVGLSKEKLQKMILTALLSISAVALLGYFYVGGQYAELTRAGNKMDQLTIDIKRTENLAKQTKMDSMQLAQAQALVQAQRATMVNGDPLLWVVREINLFAEQQPVRVTSVRPGTTGRHTLKSAYETYSTRIELQGTFDQIGAFVRDLENKYPEGEIRSLDIPAGGPPYHASLDLVLLVQPEISSNRTVTAVSTKGKTHT